jgi:hypothetical protein
MNTNSLAAAAVAVLLVAAGGGAALSTGTVQQMTGDESDATGPRDVDTAATYDNGTVTLTVTDANGRVENVTVFLEDELVGTTGANGTVTFETNETEDLELELEKGGFDGTVTYQIVDGSLVLVEEEYEYAEIETEEDEEDEETEEGEEADDAEDDEADEDDDADDADEEDDADDDETEDEDAED